MRRIRSLVLLPLVLLMACGTPQEQCIRRETSELRQLDSLIAEVQRNLDRGYALRTEVYTVPVWQVCSVNKDPNGNVTGYNYCWERETYTRKVRDAIDPASEKRKLQGLEKKRRSEARRAAKAVEACRITYPE